CRVSRPLRGLAEPRHPGLRVRLAAGGFPGAVRPGGARARLRRRTAPPGRHPGPGAPAGHGPGAAARGGAVAGRAVGAADAEVLGALDQAPGPDQARPLAARGRPAPPARAAPAGGRGTLGQEILFDAMILVVGGGVMGASIAYH